MPDNGNGTYTNPLFYDEFSDPDMIRVGEDFYLAGTTMHAMPSLVVLHSKDLVNWKFLSYAADQLDWIPRTTPLLVVRTFWPLSGGATVAADGAALAGLIGLVSARAADPAARRPNFLFVFTDDQRWDALSLAGNPHLQTPNIDRLGKEGVYFKNTFCTTSLCSPSRASILSGLYAHTHGVQNNFTEYPANFRSFPMQLQAAGYDTAYFGKWHMGENNDQPRPGFNWFVTHKGQGKYYDTEWNQNGAGGQVIPGYYTHVVTQLAEDWLKRDHSGKPWLLMVGHKAPHSFYFPEPKYSNSFDNVWIPYPESAFRLDDKPKWLQERIHTWHGIYGPLFEWRKNFPDSRPEAVKDFAAMVRAYWGTVLSVDDSVGRLVAFLKASGQFENTVFIVMSDNGASQEGGPNGTMNQGRYFERVDMSLGETRAIIDEIGETQWFNNYPLGWAMAGNTPCKFYKQNTHGGGVRDPFVIHWPKGIDASQRGTMRSRILSSSKIAISLPLLSKRAVDPVAGKG